MRLPPKGFLSRTQAQDLAGVSHLTLMEWERRGYLHPFIGRSRTSFHECFYYDATELAKVPGIQREKFKLSAGEIAARVFECLRANKTIADIVIELRIEPAAAEDLREQWLESEQRLLVVSASEREDLERALGRKVSSPGELIEAVQAQRSNTP